MTSLRSLWRIIRPLPVAEKDIFTIMKNKSAHQRDVPVLFLNNSVKYIVFNRINHKSYMCFRKRFNMMVNVSFW